MFGKNGTINRKAGLVFGTLMALTAVSMPASASGVVSGIPSQVEFAAAFLYVQHNSSNYVAKQASPGCGIAANTVDTIKTWTSLAQSALLANKQITIYFETCAGIPYILDIVLIR